MLLFVNVCVALSPTSVAVASGRVSVWFVLVPGAATVKIAVPDALADRVICDIR
jgi:hypothetical protein